ncbi:AAA family ATPase [Bradyrhizobium sp. AZCC 2289]|uniref:AAA family ATPase n=1 Tax=Bradyrhizobium sp. AZCC 2289 TaxID=3117026 RepID=UPI002FF35181
MIKLISAHIEEVRGIRKLDITFDQKNFAISGPNGSGKSGVIDAIEFGLTGEMGRLQGRGTKGLSVAEHGPHVDKTKFPDAAFVELKVYIPALKKEATVHRKVSSPKKPKITPNDADVKAALADIAAHPEITLSRREILRFILVEPTARSEEIQAILKLDDVGHIRSTLNTAQNRLQTLHKGAESNVGASRQTLQRHLQIEAFQAADVLAAINARRKTLGLTAIETLAADTELDAGLTETGQTLEFNKQSMMRDLHALGVAVEALPHSGADVVAMLLATLGKLEADPSLLDILHRRELIEKGLNLIDGPDCPLCDKPWDDEEHLRAHLGAKLAKSNEAARLRDTLVAAGGDLSREVTKLSSLLGPIILIATSQEDTATRAIIEAWVTDLGQLKGRLASFDGLLELKPRLEAGWYSTPKDFAAKLGALKKTTEAKPDQTATVDARTFLLTAQLRLNDYRNAMRQNKRAEADSKAAKAAYDTYCGAMETELNALYESVENDFSAFYRAINEGDEVKFAAKLTPSEGKLDFAVNFYERGLFPPAAFHSEGHQDGMGVCLYLALMKHLLGDSFTIALLDDVVMSVDTDHRYQFCKLLKAHFPNTQFIITTHDRVWAEQMRSAGLVTTKTSLAFHSWTVDTGPLVESNVEIWDDIAASLAKGKVEAAAAALRHHLEYVSRLLANDLGAQPVFKADGNFELGELMPSVLVRLKDLCGKAADAAQSWGQETEKQAALERKSALSSCNGAVSVEQWAVNKAVHYNAWANFGRKDFEPVVAAFRELLDCFRCGACDTWLHVTPRGSPETVRCSCNEVSLNLKRKAK